MKISISLDTNLFNRKRQLARLQDLVDPLVEAIQRLEQSIEAEEAAIAEAHRRVNALRVREGKRPYPDDCLTKAQQRAFDVALRRAARLKRRG